jgi:hypothetical protein
MLSSNQSLVDRITAGFTGGVADVYVARPNDMSGMTRLVGGGPFE